MKTLVNKDIVKATRKLTKLTSACGLSTAALKNQQIFQKPSAIRRKRAIDKLLIIKKYNRIQKKNI